MYLPDAAIELLRYQATVLRDRERRSRDMLRSGIFEDLSAFDTSFARALAVARKRVLAPIATGSAAPPALTSELTVKISMHCRRSLAMYANLRYRARCASYAGDLQEAECGFVSVFARFLSRAEGERLQRRPRIARPNLELDVVGAVVGDSADPAAQSLDRFDALRTVLSVAVNDEVWEAYRKLTQRGATSMARVQAAVASALIAHARRGLS